MLLDLHASERTYTVPGPHAVVTNLPLTHCAKAVPTQAFSPAVQGEFASRVANFWLQYEGSALARMARLTHQHSLQGDGRLAVLQIKAGTTDPKARPTSRDSESERESNKCGALHVCIVNAIGDLRRVKEIVKEIVTE